MIQVGKTIQKLRIRAKVSQRALARSAKITPSYLSLVENERRVPSLTVLQRIAGALRIPEEVIVWDAVELPKKLTATDRKLFDAAKAIVRRFYEATDVSESR